MASVIKIFVIGPRGFPGVQGGIERFSESFYPRLAKLNYDVTSFAIKRYSDRQEWNGVKFIYVRAPKSKLLEKTFYNIQATLHCLIERPDIIHVHSIASGFFIFALTLFRLKVVARYNSMDYLHSKWNKLGQLVLKLSERQFLLTDYIVVNNRSYLDHFKLLGRTHSISYVPNGIDIPDKNYYLSVFDEKFSGLFKRDKFILYVGRVTEEKNIQTLLESFKHLPGVDYKLAVAGDASHRESFLAELKEKYSDERVVFLGKTERDSLNSLYAGCAVFVIPSLHEGMPNALLEAMSFNCKILASKIPAHLHFNFDENSYFNPLDSIELTEKLKRKLEVLSQEDHVRELALYNWATVVDQFHSIHLSLINF